MGKTRVGHILEFLQQTHSQVEMMMKCNESNEKFFDDRDDQYHHPENDCGECCDRDGEELKLAFVVNKWNISKRKVI